MSHFKKLEDITKPDITAFVVLDREAPGGFRPVTLKDDYERGVLLALPESVPESVASYWNAMRMLWVHGWFYYPFYTMATLHAYLCVEIALKERHKREGIEPLGRKSTMAAMLKTAVEREWLVPEGFGNINRRMEAEREWENDLAVIMKADPTFTVPRAMPAEEQKLALLSTMKRHLDVLRNLRNLGAHPDGLSVRLPGMTLSQIEYARDLISQLF